MNKKPFFLCLGMLVSVLHAFSQKVDIDNVYFNISNCELPYNYIEPDMRTYKVFLSGNANFTGADKQQDIKIQGWQRVSQEDPSTVDIKVTIGSFTQGLPETKSETKETKDKSGNVTSRTVEYWTTVTNTGNGQLVIDGIKNEQPPFKKDPSKESKYEKKLNEKEKEKAKEKAANPFLKNVDLADQASTQNSSEKIEAYVYSLNTDYTFTTERFKTISAAEKSFSDNFTSAKNGHQNDFRNNYVSKVNKYVNKRYGYIPVNNTVRFKKMDSKKHLENDMFNAAITATEEIFKKMRYNKSPDEIRSDLIPVLNYFNDVAKKYAGDDKENIKLRGAALYNQARINLYLDNHDKVIELSKELALTGKKNEKAAERFTEESSNLKETLAFHKMTSRHFILSSPGEDEDNLGETIVSEDEEE